MLPRVPGCGLEKVAQFGSAMVDWKTFAPSVGFDLSESKSVLTPECDIHLRVVFPCTRLETMRPWD